MRSLALQSISVSQTTFYWILLWGMKGLRAHDRDLYTNSSVQCTPAQNELMTRVVYMVDEA